MPSGVYKRTKKHLNSGCFVKGMTPWNKGLTKDEDDRLKLAGEKISKSKSGVSVKHEGQFQKGFEPHNKGIKGYQNNGTFKKGHKGLVGEENPRWNGGPKKIQEFRRTFEYKEWRKNVFEKDNYTCQLCGKRGGKLIADHHPYPFALYPDKMYEVENGRSLCVKCNYVQTYIIKNWKKGGV